jgi:hypothetical protein
MPDPNKRKPRLESRAQADRSKTPKVRKDPKFIGTQKYGREFMCKVQHNGMTNGAVGKSKFRKEANSSGVFTKRAMFQGKGKFPSQKEGYLGGMTYAHTKRVPTATNLQRGSITH